MRGGILVTSHTILEFQNIKKEYSAHLLTCKWKTNGGGYFVQIYKIWEADLKI